MVGTVDASRAMGSTSCKSSVSSGRRTWSTRITFGHVISNVWRSDTTSTRALGLGGGGAMLSSDSCGRNEKGIPKMLTYSGSNNPDSGLTS